MEEDFRNWEFKIVCKKIDESQKLLNQWKHDFGLRIIYIKINPDDNFVDMVIARRRF